MVTKSNPREIHMATLIPYSTILGCYLAFVIDYFGNGLSNHYKPLKLGNVFWDIYSTTF